MPKKRYVAIRLNTEEVEKLKEIADREVTTVSGLIRKLIINYLRELGEEVKGYQREGGG